MVSSTNLRHPKPPTSAWLTLCAILLFPLAATRTAENSELVLIRDVPHVRQKPDFCGEACVASWIQKLGASADQDDVFEASGLAPELGRGCYTKELSAALHKLGFEVGPVWHRIAADQHIDRLDRLWNSVVDDLLHKKASVICMRTTDGEDATEHFRLILGYDRRTDEVIYHEPAADDGAYRRMPREELLRLWPLKTSAKEWTVIRFALPGDRIPRVVGAKGRTAADYAQHIRQLKKRLPAGNFSIVVQPPFVVIGDEPVDVVRQRATRTVEWATVRLKSAYFSQDPHEILDVWLFKNRESYESNALHLFGRTPSTPYGYYSPTDRALVMNIATGGGTLVHEIVHPFMEANFSQCPAWFNEGLGSLYEQSSSRNGQIVGLTNWRLAGLQQALQSGKVPAFRTLCSTTDREFYHQDQGTNYAQARYLCFYLQEQGLLRKFYHEFEAHQADDPTGYQTLRRVLGNPDMDDFQSQWKSFVLKLRFEP